MKKLSDVARLGASAPRVLVESLVLVTGSELLRKLPRSMPAGGLSARQLTRAMQYIREIALTEDVTLAELAGAAGLSAFHFARAFKRSTGFSPYQFLLRTRIDEARRLMADEKLSLSAIASATGFRDSSHFSRTFHRVVGMTPREYRRRITE